MAEPEIHREIEGGNADFVAGCVLSRFNINPCVRITSKFSIKSDANTVLVSWRPSRDVDSALIKGEAQSIAGSLRFCHRSPLPIQGCWRMNTIFGFYQPEHAHAALKHFNSSSGREAILVYTVYFTASRELTKVVLSNLEQVDILVPPEIQIACEDLPGSMVILRLSGMGKTDVLFTKLLLQIFYNGYVATSSFHERSHEIWHDFFATPPGEIWLRHLERDIGIVIISDKLQQRLRIYDYESEDEKHHTRQDDGNDNDGHEAQVVRKLTEKINELDSYEETHSITLNTSQFQKLIASDAIIKAQKKLGETNVNLDILKKMLVLRCTHQAANSITNELGLPAPPPKVTLKPSECPLCGDTNTDIQFSDCGHSVCRDCFDHQTKVASSDLTSNYFPLVCWHEDCEKPVSIPDLRKFVTSVTMDALLQASLTYHIRSFPDIYRNCRTPDCKSVYLRNGSYEIFTCPKCLTQTCTSCHAEPHVGWTCPEYEIHLRKMQFNEDLLDTYKAEAGTKGCPKCATLIEKVDGCNHVECSGCHGHICWVCLKVFAKSASAYQHMNDVHEGIGLGAELVDFEEEEEEDDDDDLDAFLNDDDDDDDDNDDNYPLWYISEDDQDVPL